MPPGPRAGRCWQSIDMAAFTYVRSPGGVLFEPESGLHGSKERFERWYAGGSLF